jgi:hypothetical protein
LDQHHDRDRADEDEEEQHASAPKDCVDPRFPLEWKLHSRVEKN